MQIKKLPIFLVLILSIAILLPACGTATPEAQYIVVTATSPAVAVVTNTPDPCAPENIEAEVQLVHKYMREYDDASSLAASRPREQLADAIAELQTIRRNAEDQRTPACLVDLKTYQISHMNSVINTLIAFMGGSDQQAVDQGIAQARDQHDRYTVELARVLGLTVEPATTISTPVTDTPSP